MGLSILDELHRITQRVEQDFKVERRLLSFREYLELFATDPGRYSRDACRYVRDMFEYYGREKIARPWGEETRFRLFDLPFLEPAEAAREALVGQEQVQEEIFRALENFAREGRATALSAARLPIDEVHDVFERRPNYFPAIEEEAEAFTALLDPGEDLFGALKTWLKREYGIVVKVLPVATMPNWRRRYDRHSQRLFLSERLSPFDQLREVAMVTLQMAAPLGL